MGAGEKQTWCKESSTLRVVRLASALVAVRRLVLTGLAVHDVEVVGAEGAGAVTELGKVTRVGGAPAGRPGHSELGAEPSDNRGYKRAARQKRRRALLERDHNNTVRLSR